MTPDGTTRDSAPPTEPSTGQLRRLFRRQESVRAVVETISGELELQPLLESILQHACQLIGAEHGTLGLVDPERDLIRTAAGYRMPPGEAGAEMPRGVGLAGVVLDRRVPVLARYGDLPQPTQTEFAEHSVIGMPIEWEGQMIGFLGVGAGSRTLGPEEAETLALFARPAAIAIANARRYEDERWRRERMALVARIARLVTGDLRLGELLQRAADAIHELLGYPNLAIPLIDPEQPGMLVLRVKGGHYKRLIPGEYRIPVAQGLMGAAVRTRQTVLVNDVASDPRYLATPGAAPAKAELAVPILLGERVLGVVNVERDEPFDEEDAAIVGIIADQLAVAIENARLYASAQQVAVLEERQRLARELHDAVTQHLSSLTLIAQTVGPAYGRGREEGEARARRLVELSQTALDEMRVLLAELRPGSRAPSGAGSARARLRRHGLAEALARLAADVSCDAVPVDAELSRYVPRPLAEEEALYRIAQEALSNATKHARASRIQLRLAAEGASTVLQVSDDGGGFGGTVEHTGEHAVQAGGLGLLTMRERATAIGGSIRIDSTSGTGTTVEVTVPHDAERRA
ncbi:MAG TPA: GAF domain-containing protein [Gemmatimonadales bacterium]|jgi:signal transduction histidine kinase|nr:GAF domain-containing protein [Gemmatimonadales bacterium]